MVGWEGDYLRVRLAAVPEKGKANQALIQLLSEILHIPKSHLSFVSGETSRLKRIRITGLTLDEVRLRVSIQ